MMSMRRFVMVVVPIPMTGVFALLGDVRCGLGDELLPASVRAEKVVSAVVSHAMRAFLRYGHPANDVDRGFRCDLPRLAKRMSGVRTSGVLV
jgi:hypothetical protein